MLITWNEKDWDSLTLPLGAKRSTGKTSHNPKWLVVATRIHGPADKEVKAALYKTPEECFDASETAASKGDFKTAVGCLAPRSQKEMAASSAVMVLRIEGPVQQGQRKVEAEDAAKAFKPVFEALDRHRLTEKATRRSRKAAKTRR